MNINNSVRDKAKYLIVGFFIGILFFRGISIAGVADPGSEDDPLVTLSYIEDRLTEFTQNILILMNEKIDDINSSNQEGSTKFQVINIKEGQVIILSDSTEFILRSGKGIAIGSENGGLSDLTEGNDIKDGEEIPLNHHLLIPRDDGRGVSFSTEAYAMVKGEYTIKNSNN